MNNVVGKEFNTLVNVARPRLQDLKGQHASSQVHTFVAALKTGDIRTVREYTEYYADALTFDFSILGEPETALHIAAKGGQTEVIGYLAGRGANLDSRGPTGKGDTPAEVAALSTRENAVLRLLDLGAKPSGALLMFSALRGLPEAVERLLDMGYSANAADSGGDSVLMKAALGGTQRSAERQQIVDLLLKRGADPLHENQFYQTAVSMALLSENVPLAANLDKAQRSAKAKVRAPVFSRSTAQQNKTLLGGPRLG